MARTKKRSPGGKSPKKKVVVTPKRLEPPYSLRFNKKSKKIEFKCTLHKVPPQFIEFHPTPTRLVLHTKKYSKPFYIDVPYPHNVTVAADDSTEAQLENGILSATFDIISEMPEIAETVKVLGKRQKNETTEESSPPAKRKKTSPKKTVEKPSNVVPVPLASSSESEQEETEAKPKKTKKTFVSKETSLEMIDAISSKVEGVITAKLEKENSKMEWQAERKEVREKRKQNRQEKKKEERQAILSIIEEQEKQKKTKKKKSSPVSLPVPDFEEDKPENDQQKIKGILKSPHSCKTNNSVRFSPALCQVKAIPRVKSPAFQKREMLASLQQQKRKKNKKSRIRSKRR